MKTYVKRSSLEISFPTNKQKNIFSMCFQTGKLQKNVP